MAVLKELAGFTSHSVPVVGSCLEQLPPILL